MPTPFTATAEEVRGANETQRNEIKKKNHQPLASGVSQGFPHGVVDEIGRVDEGRRLARRQCTWHLPGKKKTSKVRTCVPSPGVQARRRWFSAASAELGHVHAGRVSESERE